MTPTGRLTALHRAFFSFVLPCNRALFLIPASTPLSPPVPWFCSRCTGRLWLNPLRLVFVGRPGFNAFSYCSQLKY